MESYIKYNTTFKNFHLRLSRICFEYCGIVGVSIKTLIDNCRNRGIQVFTYVKYFQFSIENFIIRITQNATISISYESNTLLEISKIIKEVNAICCVNLDKLRPILRLSNLTSSLNNNLNLKPLKLNKTVRVYSQQRDHYEIYYHNGDIITSDKGKINVLISLSNLTLICNRINVCATIHHIMWVLRHIENLEYSFYLPHELIRDILSYILYTI